MMQSKISPLFNMAIAAIFGFTVLCACARTADDSTPDVTAIVMNISSPDSRFIHSVLDTVTYVGIDADEHPIHMVDKICKVGTDLLLLDSKVQQIVSVDTRSGKCRYVIDSYGQGPDEFLEISAFCADDSMIYVLDNMKSELMLFSRDNGTYVRSLDMPMVADDMEVLPDGGFIFASIPLRDNVRKLSASNHRLFITDSGLNVTKRLFPYSDNEYDPIGQRLYLTRNGGDIVFGSLMNSGFTILSGHDMSEITHVNIAFDKPVDKDTELQDISDCQYMAFTPFTADGYYYICYSDGAGKLKYGVWDKEANQLLVNEMKPMTRIMGPVIGSYDNKMIGMITSSDQYRQLVEHGFPEADQQVVDILDNDGYALIEYHLQQS